MKMMTKTLILAGACTLFCSCASTRRVDSGNLANEAFIENTNTISFSSMKECSIDLVQRFGTSVKFQTFLKKYKEQHGADEIPWLQIGQVKNQTNDDSVNTKIMTDLLRDELINSGLVDVTLATGTDIDRSTSDARDLIDDPNFDKSKIAKKGQLIPPSLSLGGAFISQNTKDGRDTRRAITFNLTIVEIKTGRVIWAENKDFVFDKTKGIFGF